MHTAILTGVQIGCISLKNKPKQKKKKQPYFAKKRLFLRLYFRDEDHLYAKCLFDILTIYPKLFILNVIFFISSVVAYVCAFPS